MLSTWEVLLTWASVSCVCCYWLTTLESCCSIFQHLSWSVAEQCTRSIIWITFFIQCLTLLFTELWSTLSRLRVSFIWEQIMNSESLLKQYSDLISSLSSLSLTSVSDLNEKLERSLVEAFFNEKQPSAEWVYCKICQYDL